MFKQLSMVVLVSAALTACGGSDNKKSSSSAAASSMPASVAASSTPASVAASSMPASVAASSMPASVAASSTPASVAASSAASNMITADLTQGWEAANGGGTVSYNSQGVMYVAGAPTQYDSGVFFLVPGPIKLEGASFTISMIPDAAFIASKANPQPFAQVNGGSYAGEYDCWFNNSDLVEGVVNKLTCTISQAGAFNITDTTSVRIGFQLNGVTSYAGTASIVGAVITLAP